MSSNGPLAGLRVIEMSSIGPGPHCCMMLSDMGAEVLRIDRPGGNGWPNPIADRGRHTVEVDIRNETGRSKILEAASLADVIVEGFRPGTMERLGLGPNDLCNPNARLIYARVTGWGQTGPRALSAGHDINFIALTGALHAITGDDGHPVPPLNLVGDFGGGSLYVAFGIVAALWERERSGKGQVIDAAMVDGVASMMSMFTGVLPTGLLSLEPTENRLGGRAPFYRCYECADGKYLSVGSLEPQFYRELLSRTGAPEELPDAQNDFRNWPERVRTLSELFKKKTRDEWCAILEGSDTCCAPVLTYAESLEDFHLRARSTYVTVNGVTQVAPAPRFSRTPGEIGPRDDGATLLDRWRATTR